MHRRGHRRLGRGRACPMASPSWPTSCRFQVLCTGRSLRVFHHNLGHPIWGGMCCRSRRRPTLILVTGGSQLMLEFQGRPPLLTRMVSPLNSMAYHGLRGCPHTSLVLVRRRPSTVGIAEVLGSTDHRLCRIGQWGRLSMLTRQRMASSRRLMVASMMARGRRPSVPAPCRRQCRTGLATTGNSTTMSDARQRIVGNRMLLC
mmetsp:Transcript_44578/g.96908  ORF Transcript_44578/g.96908 Transcript_44578/m.96908 type:complete len:202 (+) Transcript_44578:499-1104(+)